MMPIKSSLWEYKFQNKIKKPSKRCQVVLENHLKWRTGEGIHGTSSRHNTRTLCSTVREIRFASRKINRPFKIRFLPFRQSPRTSLEPSLLEFDLLRCRLRRNGWEGCCQLHYIRRSRCPQWRQPYRGKRLYRSSEMRNMVGWMSTGLRMEKRDDHYRH